MRLEKSSTSCCQPYFREPRASIDALLLAQGRWEGELVHTRRDGTQLTVWSRWALQLGSVGKPVCILEINSDITARKLADEHLLTSLQEKKSSLKRSTTGSKTTFKLLRAC